MPSWIDRGEATTGWPLRCGLDQQRFHRGSTNGERAVDDLSVLGKGGFVLFGRKDEQPGNDALRDPSVLARHTAGDSLIPPDLAFDGTDVVDDGLDSITSSVDVRRSKASTSNPSAPSSVDDRDLPCGFEAGGPQTTVDMA